MYTVQLGMFVLSVCTSTNCYIGKEPEHIISLRNFAMLCKLNTWNNCCIVSPGWGTQSLRLSNPWIVTKRKKNLSRFFLPYYERSLSLVFREEEWLVGDPFYLKLWVNRPRSEIANFEPIFARSTSAVTRVEKSSINTNSKSTTRFPMSLRQSS